MVTTHKNNNETGRICRLILKRCYHRVNYDSGKVICSNGFRRLALGESTWTIRRPRYFEGSCLCKVRVSLHEVLWDIHYVYLKEILKTTMKDLLILVCCESK